MILYILNVYYFVISNIKKRFTVLCKPLNAFFVNIFHFYFCFVNFTSSSDEKYLINVKLKRKRETFLKNLFLI